MPQALRGRIEDVGRCQARDAVQHAGPKARDVIGGAQLVIGAIDNLFAVAQEQLLQHIPRLRLRQNLIDVQADVLLQFFQAVQQVLRLAVGLRNADVGRVGFSEDALQQGVGREHQARQRGRLVGGDFVEHAQQAESVVGQDVLHS